jgi:hypothetical protein
MLHRFLLLVGLLCVCACGPSTVLSPLDGGSDAGVDAGNDAGLDAGNDAGLDAGTDAGSDAGSDAGTDAGSDAGLATAPTAPSDVTAEGGDGLAQVTWSAPEDDGGAPILRFEVTSSPGSLTLSVDAPATSASFTGLTNGTSYTFTVSAINDVGESPPSSPSNAVTPIAAPSDLAYASNPATYVVGEEITPNVPSQTGGAVATYSVAPGLPSGLTLDPMTGVISGTPSAITSSTGYTVTATNTSGSASITLSITVNGVAPSALSYATNPADYSLGEAIPDNAPSVGAGAVTSYAIDPPLPAGLTLDPSTGILSGTPLAPSAAVDHQVTASNAYGSTTVTLSIAVTGETVGTDGTLAAGGSHTCAVLQGGAYCWGSNASGELGDGTLTDHLTPQPVQGLTSGVLALAAGRDHTCALVGGAVWCWGSNAFGQLGAAGPGSAVPVSVSGLPSGAQGLVAGAFHTCALVDGGVWCWGANDQGQLGDGSVANSATPVELPVLSS